jgi:hypothetical protein
MASLFSKSVNITSNNMSEPIPESIPTSADPRSKRPVKKRALSPLSKQSASIEALFANPDREVKIPTGPVKKTPVPPPEIVANVQGSSAGAGSGEFHVYKQSRRREYERVRMMEEEVEKEDKNREWEEKQRELRDQDDKKTNKNRAKRQKKLAKKEKAKLERNSIKMDVDKANGTQNGQKESQNDDESLEKATNDETYNIDVEVEDETGIMIHDEDLGPSTAK